MALENDIIRLFDYQKFALNEKLKKLIDEAEKEYDLVSELSDEDIEQVWAAGDPDSAYLDVNEGNDDDND